MKHTRHVRNNSVYLHVKKSVVTSIHDMARTVRVKMFLKQLFGDSINFSSCLAPLLCVLLLETCCRCQFLCFYVTVQSQYLSPPSTTKLNFYKIETNFNWEHADETFLLCSKILRLNFFFFPSFPCIVADTFIYTILKNI